MANLRRASNGSPVFQGRTQPRRSLATQTSIVFPAAAYRGPRIEEATPPDAAILTGIGLEFYKDEQDTFQRVHKPGKTYQSTAAGSNCCQTAGTIHPRPRQHLHVRRRRPGRPSLWINLIWVSRSTRLNPASRSHWLRFHAIHPNARTAQ